MQCIDGAQQQQLKHVPFNVTTVDYHAEYQ